MSSLAAFAAVAAVVGVSLPEQISAAGTSVATTQEVQVQAENAAQEQALAAPSKAAPSVVMPALGVALLLTLSTTLFLLLRCIQSRASPDREGAVNVRNLSAGGDEEDPCKELEEKLAEGFDESLITGGPDPDTKFYTLEDLKREGLYETILLPEPDPARDVGLAEAEEIIDAMEKVLKFIEEGEQSGNFVDSEDVSTGHRLREAIDLYRENKQAQHDSSVPEDIAAKFWELIQKIEQAVERHHGSSR